MSYNNSSSISLHSREESVYELEQPDSHSQHHFNNEYVSDIEDELDSNPSQRRFSLFSSDGYQQFGKTLKKKKTSFYVFIAIVSLSIVALLSYIVSSTPSKQEAPGKLEANRQTNIFSSLKLSEDQLKDGAASSSYSSGCSANKSFLSFADYTKGLYVGSAGSINYIKHPTDSSLSGLYLSPSGLEVESVNEDFKSVLATEDDIKNAFKDADIKAPEEFDSITPSFDWEYLLLQSDLKQIWRHSSISTFHVYNIKTKQVKPLHTSNNNLIVLATWAPVGHKISYVIKNDLYVSDINTQVRVTEDGGENIFNGLSDWVYEEEVFATPQSHWWSPDGSNLLFVKYNDTLVSEMKYSLYHSENEQKSYPEIVSLKYPKVGFANPSAILYSYNANMEKNNPQLLNIIDKDWIITQIAWVTKGSSNAIVKVANRIQNHFKIFLITQDGESGYKHKMVRDLNTKSSDNAWIEITQTLIYVPKGIIQNNEHEGYIDIVENDGFVHLGFFSPLDNPTPIMLTEGKWDVIDASARLNVQAKHLYFLSTIRASYSTEVYYLDLKTDSKKPKALTPVVQSPKGYDKLGSYGFEISKCENYISLSYVGPSVPWSAVYSLKSTPDLGASVYIIKDNSALRNRLQSINLPTIKHYNITIPGVSEQLDCSIIFPPCYDPSKKSKYSVLVNMYSGPNSKHVTENYRISTWNTVAISASLNKSEHTDALDMVIVNIDPRGTAHKGRAFSRVVSRKLGVDQAKDIVAATEYVLKENPSFDSSKVAIWGWSYGGYMTLKVLEVASQVFKAGVSVAPVTDWKFYDTVYTERYMDIPENNADGYRISAVSDYASIAKKKLLLMHGTGDDNVHIQNSYVLLDKLQSVSATNVTVMVYPDSAHSISRNNARPYLDYTLANYLFKTL
ncbi:hypothetical protein BB561_000413 [Smittium simulii]|uniref:Dipeptidyl-peptidase IV n=1 Tax=Smittium simulii TaxID=133385 RepID=A0A2T9YZA2_9FUNG|nr:hypothetical protein BB561_000413 [Smittium simulii]